MAKTKTLLRSPGILFVALVVLIAATGLVYAHWMTTLRVEANVHTGNVQTEWRDAATNDDGADNNDGELASNGLYNAWGTQSSLDPSDGDWNPGRYNKDVGRCTADAWGDQLSIQVENAYPSYHCGVTGHFVNRGSIPLRATAVTFEADGNVCGQWTPGGSFYTGPYEDDENGPYIDANGNGYFDDPPDTRLQYGCRDVPMDVVPTGSEGSFEISNGGTAQIEGDIALGVRCGFQIDPVPCTWVFDEDPPGGTWDGRVEGCDPNDPNDDTQCAYDEQGTNLGPVHEECGEPVYEGTGWFHVLQPASQNAEYRWRIEQEFVNWNEFWAGMCTAGVPVVLGDGTQTGQYACANDVEGGSWVDPTGTPYDGMVFPADLNDCLTD